MNFKDMDTPCLLLDKGLLIKNINTMAQLAKKANTYLRPHIKAHKCSQIARLQIRAGAKGVTVAKLGEAEVMFNAGIKDILLAYPVVSDIKLERLAALIKKGAKITCLIDGIEQAKILNNFAYKQNIIISVYVEVDTGLKRTGLEPQNVLEFIKEVLKFANLKFSGILTHAGQVYGAQKEHVSVIGTEEGLIMEKIAVQLKNQGIHDFQVSVGATPTVKYSAFNSKVTEIRPGNYVFNDAIQIGLGVAEREQCSLRVLTTVISKPSAYRLVIDAGSKTLALDKGAHGNELVSGFGIFVDYPNLILERLSEEHGVVTIKQGKAPQIGEKLLLVPNHACPVVNLADELYVLENNQVTEIWDVDARGKNK